MCGTFLSDLLLREACSNVISLSHPDSDSLSPEKEGSRKKLILKISSPGNSHARKVQEALASLFNTNSEHKLLELVFKAVLLLIHFKFCSSPLMLFNSMEQSIHPISQQGRATARLCSLPASGGSHPDQRVTGILSQRYSTRNRKAFCISAYIHKRSSTKRTTQTRCLSAGGL